MKVACFPVELCCVIVCLCALLFDSANGKVSVGMYHACAVTSDMYVKCWGQNENGQLGTGDDNRRSSPVSVQSLSAATAVASGSFHTCALLSSGGVKCWGNNQYGQLGDSSGADSFNPVSVQSLANIVSIASGAMHSCAIESGGKLYCWGYNGFGQIGDGTQYDAGRPTAISLGSVDVVSAGQFHTCAVLIGGGVECWGDNTYGQLGDGSTTRQYYPTSVTALSSISVTSIACGGYHTCALTSSSGVYCWGSNENGQLGDGTTTTQFSPILVSSLSSSVSSIALGTHHSCAIITGTISCFGRNNYGQLGIGSFSDTGTPTSVVSSTQIAYVSGGLLSTCAMTSSYSLSCWGNNFYGQLGDGTTTSSMGTYSVYGLTSAASIVSGSSSSHTCVVLSTGRANCWGSNSLGQLGDGTTTDRTVPVQVSSLSSISSIGTGSVHTCALLTSGSISCWGNNDYGQLGDSSLISSTVPVSATSVNGAMGLALGAIHSCALISGGTVQCWGGNSFGQLGDGTKTNRKSPVSASSIVSAVSIAAGSYHTCAVLSDGSISCWGSNSYGELGIGSTTPSSSPVTVAGLTSLTVTSISLGYSHSCASISGLSMRCWGRNTDGQLGVGVVSPYQNTVNTVTGVSGISSVHCGGYFSCARLTSGAGKCWGANVYGQLGDGTTTLSALAIDITALSGSLEVASGMSHTCSRFASSIKCWGLNSYGQLGNTLAFYQSSVALSAPTSQPSGQPSAVPSSQPSRQPSTQPTSQPTKQPTLQPSRQPTSQPSIHPTLQPSSQPSRQPTVQPSQQPSQQPSRQPSAQPSVQPTARPTGQPSDQPTPRPWSQPSSQPTSHPTRQPSSHPSNQPTVQPSCHPTTQPSRRPSGQPSRQPSSQPSRQPSLQPTAQPSVQPSRQPTNQPVSRPTGQPSGQPSTQPSVLPSKQPSTQPSSRPSAQPSSTPSSQPSDHPSSRPTVQPSTSPSRQPTSAPSQSPTSVPTTQPSSQPSQQPSSRPSLQPTMQPTRIPSTMPTIQPTTSPTMNPSSLPSAQPSGWPSSQPSDMPTTSPSNKPSSQPSNPPTSQPSRFPTGQPSKQPTVRPSSQPSTQPTTKPSIRPSSQPSVAPSGHPSSQPTTTPSKVPSSSPTKQPTVKPSSQPSSQPFLQPSSQPTCQPSVQPSPRPSRCPTAQPSVCPSTQPSVLPSRHPTAQPSNHPTVSPSSSPSGVPTRQPLASPTGQPSRRPSLQPSSVPSAQPSRQPTSQPSETPTSSPTNQPSEQPSNQPSCQPVSTPTRRPTSQPSRQPSVQPTSHPTHKGTSSPTTLSQKINDIIAGQLTNAVRDLAINSLQANGSLSKVVKTVQVSTDVYKASYSLIGSLALQNQTGNNSSSAGKFSVVLPGSPTAVTLSLSGSSSGASTALLITATELSSSQFVSIKTNASNSSMSAALPSPQLISSVVSIQVFQVAANGTVKSSVLPYFEASLTVSQTTNTSSFATNVLVHNCSVGTFEEVSFFCQESRVRLNLTCSGKASARIRRQCPVPRTVCSVVNLADNSIVSNDFCRAVSVGSTVLCKCGIDGDTSLANVSSLAATGKISVGAFRVYGSGSLTASVAIANSIPVSALAAKSMMIFASFGCVWGLGLILLVLSTRSIVRIKAKGGKTDEIEGTVSKVRDGLNGDVQALLDLILPVYYASTVKSDQRTWLPHRWWHVLRACHPYVRMITSMIPSSGDHGHRSSEKERIFILDLVHSLTALTMACFLLALLYDFQYPEDDGSCAAQTTAETCLASKMLLDPAASQCIWHNPSTIGSGSNADRIIITEILNGQVMDTIPIATSSNSGNTNTGYCTFNGSNDSSVAFVLSFLITALFANIFSMFLERCMVILNAQSSERSSPLEQDLHPEAGPSTTGEQELSTKERREAMEYAATLRSYPVESVESLRRQLVESWSLGRWRGESTGVYGRQPRCARPTNESAEDDDEDIEKTQVRLAEVAAIETLRCMPPPRHLSSVTWQALQTASPTDRAVMILRTAIADVISLSAASDATGNDNDAARSVQRQAKYRRHAFLLALERAFPPVVLVDHLWLWQCLVASLLVMLNGGAMYFIISKAAVRGYDWQVSFLKIAAWEWFSDVVLMQGFEIWLFDYCLCELVCSDVKAASRQLDIAERTAVMEGSSLRRSSMMTDTLLVSEMIQWFPELPEAQWMRSLAVIMSSGMRSQSRENSSSTIQSTSAPTWTLWMHQRTLRALSWLSLDGWIGIESFAAPLLLAWVIYLYYIYVVPALKDVSTVDVVVLVVVLVTAALVVVGLIAHYRTGPRVQPHEVVASVGQRVTCAPPQPLENVGRQKSHGDAASDDSSRRSCDMESIAYLEVDAVDNVGDVDALSRVERERFYSSISNSSRWCFSETFTDILVEGDDDGDDAEHRRRHTMETSPEPEPSRARFYSETSGSWIWSGSEASSLYHVSARCTLNDDEDDDDEEEAEQHQSARTSTRSSSPSSASSSADSELKSHNDDMSLPFSMSWSSRESSSRSV